MKTDVIIYDDSLNYMQTLPDKSIDLVLTDPPYGMDFQSNHRVIKYDKILNDNNLDFLDDFLNGIARIKKDDAHCYIFCSMHNVDIFINKIKKYLDYKNILIWEKNNTGMGDLYGDYAPKYEFIIYCSNGMKKLNNKRDSNILKFAKTNNKHHSTEKPLKLFQYLIKKSSNPNDIILDPFAGSCTTALAAFETNRRFICIEKKLNYVNIGKKRLANKKECYSLLEGIN